MDGQTSREIRGRVKWFDTTKGFGFVLADGGGKDVLLHANVLRNFGQNSITDGTEMRLVVNETARGLQAVEILEIFVADTRPEMPSPDQADFLVDNLEDLPKLAARVKWFDRAKGFGFANVFGSSDDVFIHAEVLRRSALSDLMPGEAVALRVSPGRRGLMAVGVYSWDSANS